MSTPLIAADRNVELKARITWDEFPTISSIASDLSKAPNSPHSSVHTVLEQRDTFYQVVRGRLKLREFDSSNAELIWYSRPDDAASKESKYRIVKVTGEYSVVQLRELLTECHNVIGVVRKLRSVYLCGQTRVHLDKIQDLPDPYVELEVVLRDDQTVEDGKRIANEMMAKLGIRPEWLVSGAYVDILYPGQKLGL